MDHLQTITLLVLLIGFLGSAGVFLYLQERRRVMAWRLRIGRTLQISGRHDFSASMTSHLVRLLTRLGRGAQDSQQSPDLPLPNPYATAGLRSPDTPILLRGVKLLGAALVPSAFLVLALPAWGADGFPVALLLCPIAAMTGWTAPEIWLRTRAQTRQSHLMKGFPDALDLMVICVEAGMGLDASINRVGQELKAMHPALGEELNLLAVELRAGRTRVEAFRNFGLRAQLEEVRNFVTVMIQTERFGTSIGQALRIHSEAARTRQRLQANETAAKLPVKLLLPLIFFILPCLFLIVLGPAVIQVMGMFQP